MNIANLIGRLADDPKLYAYGENGDKIVFITVAVPRNYKNANGEIEADFIKCQAFNEKAERINKYCKKGNRVGIVGQTRVKKHYSTMTNHNEYEQIINVDQIVFLEPKKETPKEAVQPVNAESQSDPFKEFGEEVVITDDMLPFGD